MSTGSFYNDGGIWKPTKIYCNVSGTWKSVIGGWVKTAGTWEKFYEVPMIPAGLILPYNGDSDPTGWTHFYGGGTRVLRMDTSLGVSGVNCSHNGHAINLPTAGAHTGNTTSRLYRVDGYPSNGNFYIEPHISAGAHAHTASWPNTYKPATQHFRLIQADSDTYILPANAAYLRADSMEPVGLTNLTPDGKLLGQSSSAYPQNEYTPFAETDMAGYHSHDSGAIVGLQGTGTTSPQPTGTHKHNAYLTMAAIALRRYRLAAWTSASVEFAGIPGIIGMWESSTPPSGWAICNGANGTPDLRAHFIDHTRVSGGVRWE